MKLKTQSFLKLLLAIVLLNYTAQVPYYWHQYYAPYKLLPSVLGSILLGITLLWFIIAYWKLSRGHKSGYVLMFSFLTFEFLFYLQTQILQYALEHRILLHVYRPDNILLFFVFGIGYINFFASVYFLAYMLINKRILLNY